jgi:hypothetical protein
MLYAVFAEMAQDCYRKGSSVLARLQELYASYGVHHAVGGYVIADSPEVMERIFSDIRGSEEPAYPESIAGEQAPSVACSIPTGIQPLCAMCEQYVC